MNPEITPTESFTPPKKSGSTFAIPLAIVLAGSLIAGAIYMKGNSPVATNDKTIKKDPIVAPISKEDHVLGNPDAPVKVFEYSDLQCPFCQEFHKVMEGVMASEVGKSGKVAWVYRHFWPINAKLSNGSIYHPQGGPAIEASECVAEIGGNDKFQTFIGKILESQEAQSTRINKLKETAVEIGIDGKKFDDCVSGDKYEKKLEDYYKAGREAGVTGTPSSYFVTDKAIVPISGAGYTKEELIQLVETLSADL